MPLLRRQGPENAGRDVPYLSLDWNEAEKGPTRDRGVCVTAFMLEPGEDLIVGRRLVAAFTA